jgi:hypothetical protein
MLRRGSILLDPSTKHIGLVISKVKCFCFADISQEMAINSYDIVSTLQALGMMKYWKGKHIILKKQVSAPRNMTS